MKIFICTLLCTMLMTLSLAEPPTSYEQLTGKSVAEVANFDIVALSAGLDDRDSGTYSVYATNKNWTMDLWAWRGNHPEGRIAYTITNSELGDGTNIKLNIGLNQQFETSVQKNRTSASPGIVLISSEILNGLSQIRLNANVPISKNSDNKVLFYSDGVIHWILNDNWAIGLQEEFRSERNNLLMAGPILSFLPNVNSAIGISYLTNGNKNHEIRLSLTFSREN